MAGKHGKKYDKAIKLIDPDKLYNADEAIALLNQVGYANFDEAVEVHIRLGIDPRQSDQIVRSTVLLPHGTGSSVRVAVFAEGDAARVAREAGAEIVGSDDLIQTVLGGEIDFDAAIAMADQMGKMGPLGRVIGRRGLMPNPRNGTVVREAADLPRVIREIKGGRAEFRNDRQGNLHVKIGKKSFTPDQIKDNLYALIDGVQRNKPSAAKGVYFRSITLATSMSPGLPLDVNPVVAVATEAA